MKCIVLNAKHIIYMGLSVLLILIIVIAAISLPEKSDEVFLQKPENIVSQNLWIDTASKSLDLIKENPLLSSIEPTPETTPTNAPAPTPTEQALPAPEVTEKNSYGDMDIRNEAGYDINLSEYAQKPLPKEVLGAEVLIMHTHTTECFSSSETTKYSVSENGRTTNDLKNMIAIGKIFADTLNSAGIKTVHDTTVHDYPTYNHAYTRAAATIKKNLDASPNIKIVLDIHRDAIGSDNSVKLTTKIDNKNAAQIMIVAGTDKNGLVHKDWRKNLTFAAHLQSTANTEYPGLMRNLNLRSERFNQHLTPGSLIIEVGSNTNTLEEAKVAAEAFSDVLIKVLKNG